MIDHHLSSSDGATLPEGELTGLLVNLKCRKVQLLHILLKISRNFNYVPIGPELLGFSQETIQEM